MGADPYTVESIQAALGLDSLDELVADIKMAPGVFKNNADFHLKKRALHVFGEAVCDAWPRPPPQKPTPARVRVRVRVRARVRPRRPPSPCMRLAR